MYGDGSICEVSQTSPTPKCEVALSAIAVECE